MNILDALWYAEKVNNYEIDATGATALWPDTTHYHAECPAGKRWFLIGGNVKRNVSSTVLVEGFDRNDKVIYIFCQHAAGTTRVAFPSRAITAVDGQFGQYPIFDEGEYLQVLFGTAQDAGSDGSCVVLEIDV